METLSHHDILALNRAIGEIYSARDMESYYSSAFRSVLDIIPCGHCSFNEVNPPITRFFNVISASEDHSSVIQKLLPALNTHLHEHPLFPHCIYDDVVQTTDYASTSQFKDMAVYNEYYRHLDVEMQITLSLPLSRERVSILALSRNTIDFPKRDKFLLTLLRPHLITALRNVTELSRIKFERDLLQNGAEGARQGVILFQSDGKILCISSYANEMFKKYIDVALVEGDTLPERLLQWIETEINPGAPVFSNKRNIKKSLIINRASESCSKRVEREPIIIEKEGNYLEIKILNDFTTEDYFLFITETDPSILVQKLQGYCLSSRETEVLMLLSKGKTNVEIAIILGMSRRTAEKHMEHIFDKLGVETRAAAVAILRKELPSF